MDTIHNDTKNTPTRRRTRSLTLANTEAKRAAFIAALRNSGNVRASCHQAGIARKTAYVWRDRWATFAAEWAEALEDSCDVLEAEARRRGMNVSDRLLMFLLRAHRPEVFGEKATVKAEITGKDGEDLFKDVAKPLEQIASRIDSVAALLRGAAEVPSQDSADAEGSEAA